MGLSSKRWCFLNQGSSSFSLDAKAYGNEASFVNHRDNSNVANKFVFQGGVWHIIYVAERNIQKGEQLFVSYGSSYRGNRNKLAL